MITGVFLLFSPFLQAEITLSVDRSPIVADESFQLIFESNEKVDGAPDFSPLNQSFTLLNTTRRSNTQITNGKIVRSQRWILTLMTNQSGMLAIPAIYFGKDVSKANSIKVVARAPSTKGQNTDDIFIDVEVSTKTPYVQEQVIYTIKLYRAVQTSNEGLTEPKVSGGQAIINKLDEDKKFETQLKGKRYIVNQWQYAIFPQSSGALKIEPFVFQAQTGSAGFFGFNPYGSQANSIVKRSDSIHLDIKPIPDSFTGDTWLPARKFTIQEQWSVDPGQLQQGEAATRTLTLTANGLAASHLPAIDNRLPEKLKQYPDQAKFEETNNENGFIGVRHDKMAIIPTEAGDYVLPEIKIPWWNIETEEMELAELPERIIHATPSTTASSHNIKDRIVENEMAQVSEGSASIDIKLNQSSNNEKPWQWLSGLFFILWLMTLFMWWKKSHKSVVLNNLSAKELSKRQYIKQLKQACANDNPAMAKQALLDWGKSVWSDKNITSINGIKEFCDENLQLKIDELNACLYGKEIRPWNGADFLNSFEAQSFDNKMPIETTGDLEPLYKRQV